MSPTFRHFLIIVSFNGGVVFDDSMRCVHQGISFKRELIAYGLVRSLVRQALSSAEIVYRREYIYVSTHGIVCCFELFELAFFYLQNKGD